MIISHCLNAMRYNVVFNLEEQLQKFDDESEKHAEELRKTNEVFFDPDFPPNGDSLGNRKDENGKLIVVDYGDLWLTPQEIIEIGSKKIQSLLGDNKAASGTVNESALRGDQEALRGYREYSIDVIPDEKDKKWSLYDNPWPFHVKQGDLGDCWLIAAIQCIARRKDLLEHILPIRDYTEDSGIVPVRLFIGGQWEVVKIDYHLPQYRNRERFAGVLNNQFWVSFIEKAYAKIQGSYANLKGGFSHEAFKYFTGFPAYREKVDKLWNPEKIWRRYSEYHTRGFLLAASTFPDEEYQSKYSDLGLLGNHAYSILDFKAHEGHQLILLGSTHSQKWNGKWSKLPAYDETIMGQLSDEDRLLAYHKIGWMEFDEIIQRFCYIYIGESRHPTVRTSPWFKNRFLQKIVLFKENVFQVLRINIEQRQEIEIEIDASYGDTLYGLNIHKVTEDNECGELLMPFEGRTNVSTKSLFLDPGSYFAVPSLDPGGSIFMLNWTVGRFHCKMLDVSNTPSGFSPTSLEIFHFVALPSFVARETTHLLAVKYGVFEKLQDNIYCYKWAGKNHLYAYILIENRSESKQTYRFSSGGLWSLQKPDVLYWHLEISVKNHYRWRSNFMVLMLR
ncbi:hypothetical protein GCK72_011357 [Caenorhabditis remanei]|uniref:Calpain catalytic domain-containing protein n=1 Tax=Caenorhabditis remanei TaxID=31234 RepID=A0A6A5H9K8_CAERE|nr:hypothetical protein GCK72_011357 [Caenorhabditis remanei]KAF1763092.1 hypothetical protein GCK72_011357 [Caenorhabditis remanei]